MSVRRWWCGVCSSRGLLLGRVQSLRTFILSTAAPSDKCTSRNTFYDKYKEKLEGVQGPLPPLKDEVVEKKCQPEEERYRGQPSASFYKPPDLNSVLKLDLVENKNAEEITQIWVEYHKTKDCISAVLPSSKYVQLHTKVTRCPQFVYPLPRGDGYEMWLSQFTDQRCYFTSLINYQRYQENAPISFTLTYYTELLQSKGLVLVHGEVDTTQLTVLEAQNLTNQVQLYYGSENQSERYALVHIFNHKPQDFDYRLLLDQVNNISLTL